MTRHRDTPSHVHRLRDLVNHLEPRHRFDPAADLRRKLVTCDDPSRWGGRYSCRSPACPWCRDRYIHRERKNLQKRFCGIPNCQLATVSVVVGMTRPGQVEDIASIWSKARKDLRNIIDRMRRKSPAWNSVNLTAWMECDCYDVQDIPSLGSDKKEQIAELGSFRFDDTGPVWMVTLYGIIHLGPCVSVGDVQEALQKHWSGHNQVYMEAFFDNRSVSSNINSVINYANKHECDEDFLYGEVRSWEMSWVVSYYTFLQSFSRGFQSMRVSVGAKKEGGGRTGKKDQEGLSSENPTDSITVMIQEVREEASLGILHTANGCFSDDSLFPGHGKVWDGLDLVSTGWGSKNGPRRPLALVEALRGLLFAILQNSRNSGTKQGDDRFYIEDRELEAAE